MLLRKLSFHLLMVVVLAALAGCGLGPNPARATLQATASPPPAASPTTTLPPFPTEIPPTATASPTVPATATTAGTPTADPAGTPTETTTAAPAGTPGEGTDRAEFVADVTVPDGTAFTPGDTFVKTWRLRNAGANTWSTDYVLAFARGAQMGAAASVPLPHAVAPGETVEISVDMTAPQELGSHTGFWLLRSPGGQAFGIGAEANEPVYVQINVAVTGNATPNPTSAAAGSLRVTAATLSVDQASRSGPCPQTFVFTLALTSEGAGTATYQLEAAADTPGFTFSLPEPGRSDFTGAGPRTFNASYTLQFNGSVSGQLWVSVLSPDALETNRVSFDLTCTAAEG